MPHASPSWTINRVRNIPHIGPLLVVALASYIVNHAEKKNDRSTTRIAKLIAFPSIHEQDMSYGRKNMDNYS
jgi:hypothetical protein